MKSHLEKHAPGGLEDERGKGLNKGKLYISKSSPNCVLKAYSQQFKNDFSQFLESRSQEMVHGGRMVLSFMGRESMDPTSPNCCYQWELLAQALMTLVLEVLQLFSTYIRVTSLLPYRTRYYKILKKIKKKITKRAKSRLKVVVSFLVL
ncbi:putative jasmonate O-methyltransferase [Medicago truncatula]|uniref:Putative jasmonate O-methyltransferase n=1 Tax=Medicago truncatula TaxID=3880 RepID=A0A396JLG5_MEDTR|nr:putative jasmonate O-methyltransferase [Medicago truncatula]